MKSSDMPKKEGGYIFISHSHHDIDTVRKIRNRFEELGFDPLMFFLKCLTEDNEIDGLIKREINEREWFVYVESEHSKHSFWVQSERAYIATLQGKKVMTIDAAGDIIAQTDSIARSLRIFLVFSGLDTILANEVAKVLVDKDYLVLSVKNNPNYGKRVKRYLKQQIKAAAAEGFVALLLSRHSVLSVWTEYQILLAKNMSQFA